MTAGLTRSFRASWLSLGVLCLATLAVRAETPLERGTYLMQSIVACGNCHTPKDRDGKPLADRELAGGHVINAPIFHSVAPQHHARQADWHRQLDRRSDRRCDPQRQAPGRHDHWTTHANCVLSQPVG